MVNSVSSMKNGL